MAKKVALIIAHQDFQPVEYGEPKKILENAGITVTTVSDMGGKAVSKFGDTVLVDRTLAELNPAEYDGIFLIGGPGALSYLDTEIAYARMREATKDKIWGAICVSPRILANAGLLSGKRSTGWNGDGKLGSILAAAGAVYDPAQCVVDGKLITADGPESAHEFGEAILRQLQ